MEAQKKEGHRQLPASCNVNSTFNFTVGAIAVTAALLITYLAYTFVGR